jgi:hypothetical protein
MGGIKGKAPKHKSPSKIRVKKLEAALRQLDTAIELWFGDGDAVSVHTLASAAHEVVHSILEKRYPPGQGPELLFNSLVIKDEGRSQWIRLLKKPQNFFKHADKDPDPEGSIEFFPDGTEMFILVTLQGLGHLSVSYSVPQAAFLAWYPYHHPELLSSKGRAAYLKGKTAAKLVDIAAVPKGEFLRVYRLLRVRATATSPA